MCWVGFHLPVPSMCWELKGNIFVFPQNNLLLEGSLCVFAQYILWGGLKHLYTLIQFVRYLYAWCDVNMLLLIGAGMVAIRVIKSCPLTSVLIVSIVNWHTDAGATLIHGFLPTLNTKSCHVVNFVITGGTGGCQYDNLQCHQWSQSCHYDNSGVY